MKKDKNIKESIWKWIKKIKKFCEDAKEENEEEKEFDKFIDTIEKRINKLRLIKGWANQEQKI